MGSRKLQSSPVSLSNRDGMVAILLAAFNGARFLDAQLASIAAQDWPNISIWASDDASDDATRTILEHWGTVWSKGTFSIVVGPCRGFAENFRSLLTNPNIVADYYAFADQDDVWDPDKLSRAIRAVKEITATTAALYCSRTRLVDESGRSIGFSPLFTRRPSFRNALVQSIAGGNTMVMNHAAFSILAQSARRTSFVSHDWWSYLMVSGSGGSVYYDSEPHIGYRQHAYNLVGDNAGLRARVDRIGRILAGQLVEWNSANLDGLERCADLLSKPNRAIAAQFRSARAAGLPTRLYRIARLRVYRQTRLQSLTLWLAAAVGRI